MAKKSLKWLALLGGVALGAASAVAQDSGALLDALVKKGVLNDQEAEEIRADLARDNASALPIAAGPYAKSVSKLSVGGRIQAQYIGLNTDANGGGVADPAATSHFLLRRIYLSSKAEFGPDFAGFVTYDFAGQIFDAAYVQYKGFDDLTIDAGLRKVNFGYEERTSSGSLKAIERSGVTRYFVEDNNGRRLGAGSYRVGAFVDGTAGNFFYGAAITNNERPMGPNDVAGGAANEGALGNNDVALWANAGIKGKFSNGSYVVGAAAGFLKEQYNGAGALASPESLNVYSIYTDLTLGRLNIMAELLYSDNNAGPGFNSYGFYIQPAFKLTDKLELVGRISYLDTDGRGVQVGDGVRDARSAGTFDKLTDYYLGFNYYFKGNDVKFSAGFVYADADDALVGAATSNEVVGLRSQIQVNF